MSDNQRRTFARVLFLLLCILPTVLVVYRILHPMTAADWQKTIQARLGVETEIDSVETPGPYVTVLRGLSFSDPDVGTLLEAVEARIVFDEVNTVYIPYRVKELTNKGLACLVDHINRHLIRGKGTDERWRVIFEKEILIKDANANRLFEESNEGPNPSVLVSDVQINVDPTVAGMQASVVFRNIVDDKPSELVQAAVSKTQKFGQMFQLNTNGVVMPCWLLADTAPQLVFSLGHRAGFNGRVEYAPAYGKTRLEIQGRVTQVDLERSVHVSQPGSRFGEIELVKCRFDNGTPTEWEGLLYQKPFDTPIRIAQVDLMTFRKEISITDAIAKALIGIRGDLRVGAAEPDADLR